jgi:hypothetical protein
MGLCVENNMKASILRSVLMSFGCVYALYISWFSLAVLGFGGMPIQLTSINSWIFDRYLLAIMIFPCRLFALVPRWWSTIPLWLSCLWVSFFPLFLSGESANKWGQPLGFLGRNRVIEIVCIILLPALLQIVSSVRSIDGPTSQGVLV